MSDDRNNQDGSSEWSDGGSEWETVDGGRQAPGEVDGPAGGSATASMVLGIISLVMIAFCCCYGISSYLGVILAIVALVLGMKEIKAIEAGESSAAGMGQARAGKIMGIIGLVMHLLTILTWIALFVFGMASSIAQQSTRGGI